MKKYINLCKTHYILEAEDTDNKNWQKAELIFQYHPDKHFIHKAISINIDEEKYNISLDVPSKLKNFRFRIFNPKTLKFYKGEELAKINEYFDEFLSAFDNFLPNNRKKSLNYLKYFNEEIVTETDKTKYSDKYSDFAQKWYDLSIFGRREYSTWDKHMKILELEDTEPIQIEYVEPVLKLLKRQSNALTRIAGEKNMEK